MANVLSIPEGIPRKQLLPREWLEQQNSHTDGKILPHSLRNSLELTSKPHCAPVPALHTKILLRKLQAIVGLEEI